MQIDAFLPAFANLRYCLPFLLVFLTACEAEAVRPVPAVDASSVPLEIRRFERELFAADTSDYGQLLQKLENSYPGFTEIYFHYAIPLRRGDFGPAEQLDILKAFVEYPLTREVYNLSQEQFKDLQSSKGELQEAMARYQYYLPQAEVPDTIVTFISQFQYAGFLYGDNQLAIGLDMFLGPEFDYAAVSKTETIFSDYLARTYTPAHLPSKMMQLLIEEQVEIPEEGRLIDYMVANGKKMYLLDQVLPYTPDSIKYEMTATQIDWLSDNETQIYVFLQTQELLYETDIRQYRKYIEPSPNSPGMPEGAPGRSANWLGMKIVAAWMQSHPQATIEDLLNITDGQKILAEARYKPRK